MMEIWTATQGDGFQMCGDGPDIVLFHMNFTGLYSKPESVSQGVELSSGY
jgi:hypothetical protein